jgi:hypothetical protein
LFVAFQIKAWNLDRILSYCTVKSCASHLDVYRFVTVRAGQTSLKASLSRIRRGADKFLAFSLAADGWFAAQPKHFFLEGLKKS